MVPRFFVAAGEGFEPSQTESELPEYVNYGVFPCVLWLCRFYLKKNKNLKKELFFAASDRKYMPLIWYDILTI